MRKAKIVIFMMVCIVGICIPVMALADGSGRRGNINSRGKMDFADGTVVVDSADLVYLADSIDELEGMYKVSAIDALNGIGTYFRNDGSISNDSQANEVDTEEEKRKLSFGNIKTGILQSQSVLSLSQIQAVNREGEKLFYSSQDAADHRDLLQTTTRNTGLAVCYQPITAENLTAGTAAWVDGRLIKGNGGDNASSYAQGFVDGRANVMDNLKVTYTYHYHEGDDKKGGGCYVQVSKNKVCGTISHEREYYRGSSCGAWCNSFYINEYVCSGCGEITGWSCAGGGNSCGNVEGQIGGNHVITTKSWEPACGYSQGQVLTATIVY